MNTNAPDTSKAGKRPPVVVVVGHVDHGKTSLLDYIRKTNVVAKEAGGITQSIGAYEITHNNQRVTFIDTPGHEAFGKMRARGADVADIAILVVAADEGVKPQTEESIKVLQQSETPFIVAFTKIDKPNVDVDRVKNELLKYNVLLEGYGGNVSFQGVSAKTGEGINELLDLILLTAEMEEIQWNAQNIARGVILESKRDTRKGIVVHMIMKDGELKIGESIVTPTAKGKIKVMENFLGGQIQTAIPSMPVMILGFEELPEVGEEFRSGKLSEAELELVQKAKSLRSKSVAKKKGESIIRVILKADVAGSLEALNDLLRKIPFRSNERLEILDQSVGEISDGDVKNAIAMEAIILGFRTKANKAAEALARTHDARIVTNEIIYKLVEEIEKAFLEAVEKPPAGELEILAVFGISGDKQTIGGRIKRGLIRNKAWLEIKRGEDIIGKGKIINLQQKKNDVGQVEEGKECGLIFESGIPIQIGDALLDR